MKKILSIFLAFALTFSLTAIAVFASDVPSESDTIQITVENVEEGIVTAYRIVVAVYSENGLSGYETVEGVTISDIKNPTAAEITTIATAINNGELSLESVVLTQSGTTYTGNVGAGTWIILVSESGTTAYNPMIVSAYYTDANDASSLVGSTVDADGNFEESPAVIYAKSTTTSVEKTIVDDDEETSGSSYNIGDEVTFKITTVIPDYSAAYTEAVFTITDTMSSGLDPITADDITVEVNGEVVTASDDTYTITVSDQTFTIAFVTDYILSNANKDVVITYTTTLNEDAALAESLDENTNDVALTFSNNYDTTTKVEDTVYVYSFKITDELVKISSGGSISADGTSVSATNALSGAQFTIYTDEDCTNIYTNDITNGVMTTDENGYVSFEGLEEGIYYIKETAAPSGYYIVDTVYKVEITASYNEDGTLNTYTITVTDTSTGESYENTYSLDYSGEETTISVSQNPIGIVNLKTSGLPSTGDAGAIIFLLLGAALLCFGVVFTANKKKKLQGED